MDTIPNIFKGGNSIHLLVGADSWWIIFWNLCFQRIVYLERGAASRRRFAAPTVYIGKSRNPFYPIELNKDLLSHNPIFTSTAPTTLHPVSFVGAACKNVLVGILFLQSHYSGAAGEEIRPIGSDRDTGRGVGLPRTKVFRQR